jgi:hypothetical protein
MIKIKFAPTKDQSTKVFLIVVGRKKYENPKKNLIWQNIEEIKCSTSWLSPKCHVMFEQE